MAKGTWKRNKHYVSLNNISEDMTLRICCILLEGPVCFYLQFRKKRLPKGYICWYALYLFYLMCGLFVCFPSLFLFSNLRCLVHPLGTLIVLWVGKMVRFLCLNKMFGVIMYVYSLSSKWERVTGLYLKLTVQHCSRWA